MIFGIGTDIVAVSRMADYWQRHGERGLEKMLAPAERSALDAQLSDYESKTGSQIAVLLVKSTEPEAIEQYGIRVADAMSARLAVCPRRLQPVPTMLVQRPSPHSSRVPSHRLRALVDR